MHVLPTSSYVFLSVRLPAAYLPAVHVASAYIDRDPGGAWGMLGLRRGAMWHDRSWWIIRRRWTRLMEVPCTTITMINAAEVRQPADEGAGKEKGSAAAGARPPLRGCFERAAAGSAHDAVRCNMLLPCLAVCLPSAWPAARSDMHYTSDPRCAG